MTSSCFLSGSDTGVGKTWVGIRLVREMGKISNKPVTGFKPVACGDRGDALAYLSVLQESGSAGTKLQPTLDDLNPWFFQAPLSPYAASVVEERAVDWATVDQAWTRLQESHGQIIIEGAGGIMTPLDATLSMRDLAVRWNCPVLLVVVNRLGALTQALACVECLRAAKLELVGLVLNDLPTLPGSRHSGDAETVDQALLQSNFAILEERLPDLVFRSDAESLHRLAIRLVT